MQTFETNGELIHYKFIAKPGATVLAFSNSLGTDMRIWDRVAPAFSDHFSILMYDKRGHGLSSAPAAPYTMDQHVYDLIALLNHVEAEKVVVCGDSVGGLIAQGVAAREPDRVKAVVLCDTAARIGTADMWNTRIGMAQAGGIEALADGTMERWFAQQFRSERTAELGLWRNMLVRTPLDGFVGTMQAIRDTDYTAATEALTQPALVIVGEEDGSTTPDVVKDLADSMQNAQFEIIPGAGHLPCIDQPDRLVTLMHAFFRVNLS